MSREEVFQSTLGYFLEPIQSFLEDSSVTEIMVNGFEQVYVERNGRLFETEARFASDDALISAIHNVAQYVGREIDRDRPVLDARLPDGSRVHAVIPPSARTGTYLTIRKFKRDILGLEDFVRLGSLNHQVQEFLEIAVRLHKNLVVSGGTGTGKTTMLNAVSTAIPESERIVVIEDSSELKLAQKHALYLEAQQADSYGHGLVTIRDLFRASLRMRPDRIIVGEVRGGEALDMVQSMISGHTGSLTTVHATSPRDAMVRLETLSLMSDVNLPVYVA
ncbi:MAG: ATPase, T2SS/T4P/T4SS family, partial [Planctomycetaceae bacterium]